MAFYSEKLGKIAVGISAAIAPAIADAALVTVTPAPGTVSTDSNTSWDVDGIGLPEFQLTAGRGSSSHAGFYRRSVTAGLVSQTGSGQQLNGRGLVGLLSAGGNKQIAARALSDGFAVKQTMASPYTFGLSNVNDRPLISIVSFSGCVGGCFNTWRIFNPNLNFSFGRYSSDGTANIGFQFDAGNGMQYGWAEVYTDFSRYWNPKIEIKSWTYNDTPGQQVRVGYDANSGVVPLPPSVLPALTVLALGAAGIRSMRAPRKVSINS